MSLLKLFISENIDIMNTNQTDIMNVETEDASSDPKLFDLKDIFLLLRKYKIYFIMPVIASVLVSLIVALVTTPIYRADVLLASAGNEGDNLGRLASQFGNLASIAGISLPGNSEDKSATYLATLTSRSFIEQYVVDRQVREILFQDMWDDARNAWINDAEPTAWQTHQYLNENVISTTTDRRTGLITFSIFWSDPVVAAQWANNMIGDLNNHIRQQAIEETKSSIFFLEQQLESTSQVNAQNVIYNLIEEQTKNIMLANVREEYAFKVVDPAVVPEIRVRPARRKIAIMGLLVGLLFGSLLALSKNYYDEHLAAR